MDERGGHGAIFQRAAAPSPPQHSPSSAATFARNPSRAYPSRDAQRDNARWCMAFRADAVSGAGQTDSASRIGIPVGRLGRHDASFRYERSVVKVRQGGTVWEVWINVDPAVLGEPASSGPGLWRDEMGKWTARGDEDYEEFCAAANATPARPQPVRVFRRWSSRRRGAGTERRSPPPAPRRLLDSDAPPTGARARGGPKMEASVPADAGGANFYAPLDAWCHEEGEESSAADGPAVGSSDGCVDGDSADDLDGSVDRSADGSADGNSDGSADGNVGGSADGNVGGNAVGDVDSAAGESAPAGKGGCGVPRREDEKVLGLEDAEAASALGKLSRDNHAGRDNDASREVGGDAGNNAGPGLNATASPFVPKAQARRDAASSPEGAAGRAAENKLGKNARAPANKDKDNNDTSPDPPVSRTAPQSNLCVWL